MSYDLHVGEEDFNYTFNVSRLFYAHFPLPAAREARGGLHSLDGLTGAKAAVLIEAALTSMHAEVIGLWSEGTVGTPEFCRRYDPPNGWGSTVGAILFLGLVLASCARQPAAIVRVHA